MSEIITQHCSKKKELLKRLERTDIVSCGAILNYIDEIKEILIESIKYDIENEKRKLRRFNYKNNKK